MVVAPLAGAWIEISVPSHSYSGQLVAPLAGAWIEINSGLPQTVIIRSRPPRGGVD